MRRLRCTCGERQARVWSCSIGGYLFILCPSCNRELRSGSIAEICDRKDGRAVSIIRDKLIEDWKSC